MNSLKKEDLIFTDTDNETQKNDAVLGTLEGPCADFIDGTRNGRHYSEELWDIVFNDPIVSEMIDAGGIVGELDHPAERTETDSSRIAIIMREKPTKKNGKLWAKFDILNTPLGRIAHTLAKAGFKLGISSRGSGDVSPNYDGTEEVDPSTYDFKAFDLVLLPAVKAARLNLVTEGLDNSAFNYKKVLLESIEAASEEDKKIMKETLDNLDIKLEDEKDASVGDESLDIDGDDSKDVAVDDDKAILDELHEALRENKELANTITSLQEKLSVSYAKEIESKEEADKYLKIIRRLSNDSRQVSSLKAKISSLNEELNGANEKIEQQSRIIKDMKADSITATKENKQLLEKYSNNKKQTAGLHEQISLLKEDYSSKEKALKENISTLTENVANLENTIELKNKEYSHKLEKSNSLVEKYKRIANKAVDKYIVSQARILGVTPEEIKNRLAESYTFDDIDDVCESLREYRLNISRLPFNTTSLKENVQIKATPSDKEFILPADNSRYEDEVDDQLRSLAGL